MAVTNSPKTARKGGRLLKQLLAPLVGDASPVTVIGLCKNAGKTTAMRRLMAELGEECLGLTSVGRDGEGTDLVTGTGEAGSVSQSGGISSPRPRGCSPCATPPWRWWISPT